jgi:hypothetical protein
MAHSTSRSLWRLAAVLGLATFALAAATVTSPASAQEDARRALAVRTQAQDQRPPEKCCFTNPSYSGTCEVVPGKDETCSSILDYLNNPMSQGKAYCSNTTIRGGWKSAACSTQ